MKVMQVVLSLDCGGLENLVVELVKKFKSLKVESVIVCLEKKGQLAERLRDEGIETIEFGKSPGVDFLLFFSLSRLMRELKIDLVHTHNFGPLIYGSVAARLAGIRCLNTRHGRTDKKIPGWIWKLNSYIIPVSEDTKSHLLERNRIAQGKIKVIYNGIDTNRFKSQGNEQSLASLREGLGLGRNSFVIGHVGRLSPEKDQKNLLQAVKKMIDKNINAELMIVGDGDLRKDLEQEAQALQLNGRVKFLGYRDDVEKILSVVDAFALSSIREGLSLSILEAMASAKPVVATRVGGSHEAVRDGKTGFLVPAQSPDSLADALGKLYSDKNLKRQLGQAACRLVADKFSLDAMAQEYLKLYQGMSKKN